MRSPWSRLRSQNEGNRGAEDTTPPAWRPPAGAWRRSAKQHQSRTGSPPGPESAELVGHIVPVGRRQKGAEDRAGRQRRRLRPRRWIPDIPTYWCLIAAPSARTYCQRPRWTGWLTRPGYTPSATPAGPAAESPTSRRPRAHRRQRRHQLLATANASAHSAADVLRAAGKSRRQHVHQPLQRLRHGDRNSRLGGGRGVVPAPCRRWCRWPRRPGRRPRAAGLTCRLPVPQRPNARLSTEPGVRRSGAAVGPRSRAGRRPDPLLGVGAAEVLPKSVVVIDLGKICQS
jgi:hypothetical protein